MTIGKFILWIIVILMVVVAGSLYPMFAWTDGTTRAFMYIALGISCISTIGSYAIVSAGIKKRVQAFTAYIAGGMMAKIFIAIISITIVALRYKIFAAPFVLTYFCSYLIFTGFEVFTLMRNLRPQNPKTGNGAHEKGEYK